MKKQQHSSPNSFYKLGGIEILSMQQDELSGLWKIYLSTPEHYLVSREFDRSVGMYANAPDNIVRQGLMDFSDSLLGGQLSLFKVMDMFIDRCFDDRAFDGYTENALWMCIDYPTYNEIEDILNTYNCRLRWFEKDDPKNGAFAELVERALYKTPTGNGKSELVAELKKGFVDNKITSVFMNRDSMVEKFLTDREFSDMPIFMGQFSDDGDFVSFSYMKH